MDRRSEALAQLLETALSERFATPVSELLQAMPIPIAVIHAGDLRVLAINEAMTRLVHRGDAAGMTISALLPPSHPLADLRPYRTVAKSGAPFEGSVTIDGQGWRWFLRALKGEGRSAEYLLLGLSPSGGPPANDELGHLREMNAAKTEFLNLAAHELRTPLGLIHGYGSLLAQGGLGAEHQKLAGARIYEKARQLSRLIADLSLVGRLDELGPGLPLAELDLIDVVEPVTKDIQRRFADLAINLRLEVPSAPVRGNAAWLHHAVRELLDNAVRFRPGPTGRIDVSLSEAGADWLISVVDDGFGIDPQTQGQLFKRFARIENDDNRHLVGMGIGLYLVQEVAQVHGGQALVNSQPGVGSEFRLQLPQAGPGRARLSWHQS
jgi:signal transduction histidine kinase